MRACSRTSAAGGCLLGPRAPCEQVAVADGVVPGVQDGPIPPPELEDALGHPALVAGVVVDGPPALSGPADDLDRKVLRVVDQAPVAVERLVVGEHRRRFVNPPHPRGRDVGDVGHVDADLHSASCGRSAKNRDRDTVARAVARPGGAAIERPAGGAAIETDQLGAIHTGDDQAISPSSSVART